MGCDQLWQGIGPFAPRAHVVVVESLHNPNLRQTLFPILHPRMRRRRTCPWSEKNQLSAHRASLDETYSDQALLSSPFAGCRDARRGERLLRDYAMRTGKRFTH